MFVDKKNSDNLSLKAFSVELQEIPKSKYYWCYSINVYWFFSPLKTNTIISNSESLALYVKY